MRFKRSSIILIPLMIPNISVNIMFLVNFICLFVAKSFKQVKLDIFLVLFIIWFLIFGLLTFLFTNEFGILRILALIACVPILYHINERYFTIIIWAAVIFTLIAILMEISFPNNPARLLYRSSLAEYHIARESGLFLYPGDLGHFGVVVVAWCLRPQELGNEKHRNLLLSLGLLFVFTSESRLALVQLAIFLIFYLRFKRIHLFVLISILFVSIIYVFDLAYFYSTLTILTDLDHLLNLKRIKEWIYLSDSATLLGQKVHSLDHSFFESSIVGLVLRLGLLGSVGVLFILYWSTRKYVLNGPYIWSIVIGSLVGAPLERPDLFIFTIRCLVVRKKENTVDTTL